MGRTSTRHAPRGQVGAPQESQRWLEIREPSKWTSRAKSRQPGGAAAAANRSGSGVSANGSLSRYHRGHERQKVAELPGTSTPV